AASAAAAAAALVASLATTRVTDGDEDDAPANSHAIPQAGRRPQRRPTRRSGGGGGCEACHVTKSARKSSPFPMAYVRCEACGRGHVPEVLLATIEPPRELEVLFFFPPLSLLSRARAALGDFFLQRSLKW